jgi:hypothetical protein
MFSMVETLGGRGTHQTSSMYGDWQGVATESVKENCPMTDIIPRMALELSQTIASERVMAYCKLGASPFRNPMKSGAAQHRWKYPELLSQIENADFSSDVAIPFRR